LQRAVPLSGSGVGNHFPRLLSILTSRPPSNLNFMGTLELRQQKAVLTGILELRPAQSRYFRWPWSVAEHKAVFYGESGASPNKNP
jgi:hypothetical protein